MEACWTLAEGRDDGFCHCTVLCTAFLLNVQKVIPTLVALHG